MSQVLFFIAAITAIAGAIGVITVRNPFYSVLALVIHLIALASLFLLLRAEFVAAAQVIVYAGAVMVLYVFVVAYVGGGEEVAAGTALRIVGPLFALALAIELCIAMLGTALKGISSKGAPYVLGFGTPRHIGKLFLTKYLFPFELAAAAGRRDRRGRAGPAPARPGARRAIRAPGPRTSPGVDWDDGRGRGHPPRGDGGAGGGRAGGRGRRPALGERGRITRWRSAGTSSSPR
jgi:NADH:ubiquinone oxidoreductase subunit 6 (subunit J)